ncbi:MAG: MerR family transcriptional regulator [Lachnospiraceae bacterium]
MDYLTCAEMAEKWNITSRMAANYCKSGRIKGAIKKGKTWLVPINAEKPFDKRYSKNKMQIEENAALPGDFISINQTDKENYNSTVYHSNDLYKNLGLTRETLRYYEGIGLISPERSKESQYREFTFADVSQLMWIDFYKKRGFSPLEIRELLKADNHVEIIDNLESKIGKLSNDILEQQKMLERLKESTDFYKQAVVSDGEFSIREFPLYVVNQTFEAVSDLTAYQDKVIQYINLKNEDILSNMARAITFDETGFKGSVICMLQKAEETTRQKGKMYLENGKCLCKTFSAENHDDSIMEKMFFSCHAWADKQGVSFKGVVYIFLRFVTMKDKIEHNFYEIWLPLK